MVQQQRQRSENAKRIERRKGAEKLRLELVARERER